MVDAAEAHAVALRRELRDAVRGDGVGRHRLAQRQLGCAAVHRRGRGEDDAAHALVPRRQSTFIVPSTFTALAHPVLHRPRHGAESPQMENELAAAYGSVNPLVAPQLALDLDLLSSPARLPRLPVEKRSRTRTSSSRSSSARTRLEPMPAPPVTRLSFLVGHHVEVEEQRAGDRRAQRGYRPVDEAAEGASVHTVARESGVRCALRKRDRHRPPTWRRGRSRRLHGAQDGDRRPVGAPPEHPLQPGVRPAPVVGRRRGGRPGRGRRARARGRPVR